MNRWMDWHPSPQISGNSPECKPTKPTIPGSVGFEGAGSGVCAIIEHAVAALNRAGTRIMRLESGYTIGIWSDLDSREIRQALRTVGLSRLPVRYLESAEVPYRFKLRRSESKEG